MKETALTPLEKLLCVLGFEKTRLLLLSNIDLKLTIVKSLLIVIQSEWHSKLSTTGCLSKEKSVGRPAVTVNQDDLDRASVAIYSKKPTRSVFSSMLLQIA